MCYSLLGARAQRNTERPMPKVRKRAAAPLVQPVSDKAVADWNAIHRTYAARITNWKTVGNLCPTMIIPSRETRMAWRDFRTWRYGINWRLYPYLNGKKIKVCRSGPQVPFMYERDCTLLPLLLRITLLFVASIYPSQFLFCLYSRRNTRYTAYAGVYLYWWIPCVVS